MRPGLPTSAPGPAPGSVAEVRADGFRVACRDGSVEVLDELTRDFDGLISRRDDLLEGQQDLLNDRISIAPNLHAGWGYGMMAALTP